MATCNRPDCLAPYSDALIGQGCTRKYVMLTCPHCGALNADGMSTCISCKKSLQGAIATQHTCDGKIVPDQPRQVDERYVAWQNS